MYNLGVLNDKEFEHLAKDLLDKELDLDFQIFRRGQDGGIDLRYSENVENKIIVQAKHYWASRFSDLQKVMRKEVGKIKKMRPIPERYILITSFNLTQLQVIKLATELKPYIKSTNDIYGLERINSLINKYPETHKKYYKLWLSGSAILQRIVDNSVKGRSLFYEKKILRNLKLYVPTRNFEDAIKKLKRNKFIIVTGAPGIGKTTISYLIICQLLAQKFELIYIDDKIRDAEQLLSPDHEKKQVIFFDDFLGANISEILAPRNTESTLVGFIERITTLKNKLLILTTRTTILKQAENSYEKFARSKFGSLSKYEVEITKYSLLDRARILYNHLYHSDINHRYVDVFYTKENYMRIISHRNYAPRLVDFITNKENLKFTSANKYWHFILDNFEHPSEIWKAAYENQIEEIDKFLLSTLFVMGGYNIPVKQLEEAFNARVQFEINNHGLRLKVDSFKKSMQSLSDGLITTTVDLTMGSTTVSLINPSVGDFLLNNIEQSADEKWRIFNSAIFIEQLTNYFYPHLIFDSLSIDPLRLEDYLTVFQAKVDALKFIDSKSVSSKSVEVLKFCFLNFDQLVSEDVLKTWLVSLSKENIAEHQYAQVHDVLSKCVKYDGLKNLIIEDWNSWFIPIIQSVSRPMDFEDVKRTFDLYDQDFDEFVSQPEVFKIVNSKVHRFFASHLDQGVDVSEYKRNQIIDFVQEGNDTRAKSILKDAIYDRFSEFVGTMSLDYCHNNLIDHLDIDEDDELEKFVKELGTDDDIEYEGLTESKEESLSELEEIRLLFQR